MQSLPTHPKQARVVIYSKDYCPYCDAAKKLMIRKGVGYEEIDVTHDDVKYQEMLKKAQPRRTVPQVFVNDVGLGGFDDIKKLDSAGELEKILFPNGRE